MALAIATNNSALAEPVARSSHALLSLDNSDAGPVWKVELLEGSLSGRDAEAEIGTTQDLRPMMAP